MRPSRQQHFPLHLYTVLFSVGRIVLRPMHAHGIMSPLYGSLAQLVRAPRSHRGGRRFESNMVQKDMPVLLLYSYGTGLFCRWYKTVFLGIYFLAVGEGSFFGREFVALNGSSFLRRRRLFYRMKREDAGIFSPAVHFRNANRTYVTFYVWKVRCWSETEREKTWLKISCRKQKRK